MVSKEKIVAAGKYLFLAGIALLIIRNNSYPWVIKRSSDILFFISALTALYVILRFKTSYQNFFSQKNVLTALALICSGLVAASLSGYFLDGLTFTKEGILNIGRFAEVFAILFLVSFFQSFDSDFYKKAALAQLSTLAYLPMLLSAQNTQSSIMSRFQLFENWPSNVGYYLIVSISLITMLFLSNAEKLNHKFFIFYFLGIGLSAIIIWAQSRAAWLGLTIALLFSLLFWAKESFKKIMFGFLVIAIMFVIAFLILPTPIKNTVASRIFPQIIGNIDILNAQFEETTKLITEKRPDIKLFTEPQRLELWRMYTEKLKREPLGFGINYKPLETRDGYQGPHNTILEFLVLAGPVGLAGFIWLFFVAFKNVFAKIKNLAVQNCLWLIYLFSSLAGLVVAAMFDNMSLFRLMWLIMGLGIFV